MKASLLSSLAICAVSLVQAVPQLGRSLVGSVPYGTPIVDCYQKDVIALTFDDGPWQYTEDLLNTLKKYKVRATFFVTGNNLNKGAIDVAWPATIKRIIADGHQIGSHTWTHLDLTTATSAQRYSEMQLNEAAFKKILGYYPTYMRPPYMWVNDGVVTDMRALGYHVINANIDSKDYQNDSPSLIQNSKNIFEGALAGKTPASTSWIVLTHDVHEQTAHNFAEYIIQRGTQLGYKFATVGECLNDPAANWYRTQ